MYPFVVYEKSWISSHQSLTHKQMKTHVSVISTVVTDDLGLRHSAHALLSHCWTIYHFDYVFQWRQRSLHRHSDHPGWRHIYVNSRWRRSTGLEPHWLLVGKQRIGPKWCKYGTRHYYEHWIYCSFAENYANSCRSGISMFILLTWKKLWSHCDFFRMCNFIIPTIRLSKIIRQVHKRRNLLLTLVTPCRSCSHIAFTKSLIPWVCLAKPSGELHK